MTWIERYLAAVLRSIPESKRADVERELRSSIEDAVEERTAGGEDRAAAERAVLEALGDPTALAGAYTGKPTYLIGPELFPLYRKFVPRLLIFVPLAAVVILVLTVAGGGGVGTAIMAGMTAAINVAIQIGFWATVTFVFLEWASPARQARAELVATHARWTLERLPKVQTGRIPIGETVGEIVTVLITLGILVFAASLSTTSPSGATVPLLAPAFAWPWLPILLALVAVRGIAPVAAYGHGRWTFRLAGYQAAVHVLFAGILVNAALGGQIVNPDFADLIYPGLARGGDASMLLLAFGTVLATAWEILRILLRARRSGHGAQVLGASPRSA